MSGFTVLLTVEPLNEVPAIKQSLIVSAAIITGTSAAGTRAALATSHENFAKCAFLSRCHDSCQFNETGHGNADKDN